MFIRFSGAILCVLTLSSSAAFAACQNVNGNICGSGAGIISNAVGDVSLRVGGAINTARAGASVASGDRILARNGQASVQLGSECVAAIQPNSVATISSQNGMTCVRGDFLSPGAAQTSLPEGADLGAAGGISPGILVAGVVTAGAIGGGIYARSNLHKSVPLSP